jgi:hypothetical protein
MIENDLKLSPCHKLHDLIIDDLRSIACLRINDVILIIGRTAYSASLITILQ